MRGTKEVHTIYCGVKPEGKRPLGRHRHRGEYNIKMDTHYLFWRAWILFIRLTVSICGGLLWIRQWTFGFHKVYGISGLSENSLVSQQCFWSVELVTSLIISAVNCEKLFQTVDWWRQIHMTPNLHEVLISRGDRSCEIFLNQVETIVARSVQLY